MLRSSTVALAALTLLTLAPPRAAADTPLSLQHGSGVRPVSAAALDDTGRVRRWREELHFIVNRITERHPRPFAFTSRAQFDSAAGSIGARVPRLDDAALAVECMRMVALLGDGHTMMIGTLPGLGFTQVLPLWLRPCEDGLFVGAAGPRYEAAVGARVVRIGGLPAEQALERVFTMVSGDNRYNRLDRAPLFMMMPLALKSLGICPDADRVTLELERPGGAREPLTVVAQAPPDGFPGGLLETEPRFPVGWRSARATLEPAARCERRPQDAWWFEYLSAERVMYLRIRRVDPVSGDRAYFEFYPRLFAALDSLRPGALIIDLRQDHGGNNTILDPLLRGLVGRPWLDREGGIVTLTDRGTFSAAMNAAVFLEQQTRTLFAGEPTGSRVNHYGDAPETATPNFGMMLQVSTIPWLSRFPQDERIWIAPLLAVPSTFAHWSSGRDDVLTATLDMLREGTLQGRAAAAARTGGAKAVIAVCDAWTAAHPNPWRDPVNDELLTLGSRLLEQGDAGAALAVAQAMAIRQPQYWMAVRLQGQAYERSGDRTRAAESYRKALTMNERSVVTRMMLERVETR